MAWVLLVVAGLLEAGWAIGLKSTDCFTKPLPSLLTGAALVASVYLLAVAARTLPIGAAYSVWVGIGAAGAVLFGMAAWSEPATPLRLFFLTLLLVSLMGLKLTAH
ncbi:Quaternary ammonium compound-resistance protein SugE [Posidoniimonas corsicana]|uniref:Guanidinium exporter n=1 Tax=Posidoniimonas corsicana TaxID=1938618 RepID=A0A5C5VH24_9BACT|nr:SMR family transporter [Posidoniimonas corsicana]TWT37906.1 Quaternary ammonium compound-resistance protein SugE [Posidoniimonas corsicana]